MDNQKLLSEEKYQQNNAKVKKVGKTLLIIGIITLVIGIIFIIVGFVSTGNSASNAVDTFGNNAINNFNSVDQDTVMVRVQDTFNNTKDTTKGMFGSIGLFALGGFLNFIGFVLTSTLSALNSGAFSPFVSIFILSTILINSFVSAIA